ncbi:MAG: SpoIIIAC/SpoIIIAD family protein [Clostridium sp.]
MSTATIITMLGIGVSATIAEKVLNSFGKADMASFCNIAGLAGLGMTAIGLIVKLIQTLSIL